MSEDLVKLYEKYGKYVIELEILQAKLAVIKQKIIQLKNKELEDESRNSIPND